MAVQSKIDLDIFQLIIEVITKSDNADTMANQLTQILVGALGIKGATIFIQRCYNERPPAIP